MTFLKLFNRFDLWKIQFSEGSSALLDEVSDLTFDKFMDSLTPEKVRADVMWQLASVGAAKAVGTAAFYYSGMNPLAYKLGFGLTYAGLNIWKGVVDQMEQENIIHSQTFHEEGYKGKQTLSEVLWIDDIFGNSMTSALVGNKFGVYAPVMYETDKYRYEGQLILAPFDWGNTKSQVEIDYEKVVENVINQKKTDANYLTNIGENPDPTMYLYDSVIGWMDSLYTQYSYTWLDYSLQTRNYFAYSDLDDERCQALFNERLAEDYGQSVAESVSEINWLEFTSNSFNTIGTDIMEQGIDLTAGSLDVYNKLWYAQNSITFLENEVFDTTENYNDYHLDKILPYMYDCYPTLTFADLETLISAPEFYEDYPMIVSEEAYQAGLNDHYDTLYKAWEKGDGQELRIVPKNTRHTLKANIDHIDAFIITYKEGGDVNSFGVQSLDTLDSDDYTFDETSGTLIFNEDVIGEFEQEIDNKEDANPNYEYFITLEIFIEKFRSINDTRDLTSEELKSIAAMQAIHASVLEYYYQFQLATQAQEKLNQIAYTAVITVLTTAVIAPSHIFEETMEELFLDPIIEASISGITRAMGAEMGIEDTTYAEIVASTIAETGRETIVGVASDFSTQTRRTIIENKIMQKLEPELMQEIKQQEQNQICREQQQTNAQESLDASTTSLIIFSRAMQDIKFQLKDMSIKDMKAVLKLSGKEALKLLREMETSQYIQQIQGTYITEALEKGFAYGNALAAQALISLASENKICELSDERKSEPSEHMTEITFELIKSKPKWRQIYNPRIGQMEMRALVQFMARNPDDMNPNADEHNIDRVIKKTHGTKSVKLMQEEEFLNFYITSHKNWYSERFKQLDLKNSKAIDLNTKTKIIQTFKQARHKGKYPILIYMIVHKQKKLCYVGKTQDSLTERWKQHLDDAFNPNNPRRGNFYDDIREFTVYDSNGNIDTSASRKEASKNFERIVIDCQYGDTTAEMELKGSISEEFFTIYMNRYSNSKGYDLTVNNEYNQIVGQLRKSAPGKASSLYKEIDYDELNNLIIAGFRLVDIAAYFKVSEITIERRIKSTYGVTFSQHRLNLLEPYILSLMEKGLSTEQAAKKFVKGITNEDLVKHGGWRDLELNEMELKTYSSRFLSDICKEFWGKSYEQKKKEHWGFIGPEYAKLTFENARKRYNEKQFVRPILVHCMREGLNPDEAVSVLNSLGFSYSVPTMRKTCYKIWGTSYTDMRDIFLEPIMVDLIKQGLSYKGIADVIKKDSDFVRNYIRRVFPDCRGIEDARIFLMTHCNHNAHVLTHYEYGPFFK